MFTKTEICGYIHVCLVSGIVTIRENEVWCHGKNDHVVEFPELIENKDPGHFIVRVNCAIVLAKI